MNNKYSGGVIKDLCIFQSINHFPKCISQWKSIGPIQTQSIYGLIEKNAPNKIVIRIGYIIFFSKVDLTNPDTLLVGV